MEILLAILIATRAAAYAPCPDESELRASVGEGGSRRDASFQNSCGFDLRVSWVAGSGEELSMGIIGAGDAYQTQTFAGHTFSFRALATGTLVRVLTIPSGSGGVMDSVAPCGDLLAGPDVALHAPGRESEFEALMHDHDAPCAGASSAEWSCMRYLTPAQINARAGPEYGFATKKEASFREIGATHDWGYTSQAAGIPHVTETGGLRKMRMTTAMLDALYPWYNVSSVDGSVVPHSVIPGGYTNSHVVLMDKIDLDAREQVDVKLALVREMREVLQWWTNKVLRHTSTFGLRIYHRGSMLINHFDRADTHLASAVLQIGQDVDEGGGWPLEIVLPAGHATPGHENASVVEVYLQPGEMVLYEGARIKHGRPMRFRGESFGNIFTHFAPIDHLRPGSVAAHDEL